MKKLLFIATTMCLAACSSTSEPKSDANENDTTNVVKQDPLIVEKQDTTPVVVNETEPSPKADPTLYTLILEMKNGTKKQEKFHAKNDDDAMTHMVQV